MAGIPVGEFEMIAKTFQGLEGVLADELRELGAREVELLNRAVRFKGDKELMYKANLWLRTAIKILVPIHHFKARDTDQLYDGIQQIEWRNLMTVKNTFAVDATGQSSYIKHSKFIALRTKDAIVDQFRNWKGIRPSIDTANPDIRINIHFFTDQCTVSLDSSGDSLHRRGYRQNSHKAPINEVLAAGMILLSGWKGNANFVDPMCGSGTLLIEAAMIAYGIPPCFLRTDFSFMKWADADPVLWEKIKSEASRSRRHFDHKLIGSDKSGISCKLTKMALEEAGLQDLATVLTKSFERLEPPEGGGLVMMNPPYGLRMGEEEEIGPEYKAIGNRLKQAYTGYEAWIISANFKAIKKVGLRPTKKITLFNGPLECRFQQYELYEGSKQE